MASGLVIFATILSLQLSDIAVAAFNEPFAKLIKKTLNLPSTCLHVRRDSLISEHHIIPLMINGTRLFDKDFVYEFFGSYLTCQFLLVYEIICDWQ